MNIKLKDVEALLTNANQLQASNVVPLPQSTPRDVSLAGSSRGPSMVLRCNPQSQGDIGQLECSVTEDKSTPSPTWLNLFETYRNSVVQVLAESAMISLYTPQESVKPFQARGSAFFITKEGHLLTNCHVVMKAMSCHIRREIEGERFIKARILALCPSKDLALLQIPQNEIDRLREPIVPLQFGDSDTMGIPGEVSAWGYQLGFSDIKMTIGNLTGYHRESDGLGDENRVSSYLQISSPINSGSSGGCLLNREGLVIGINSQGIPGASATGFSIPSKVVLSMLRPLFNSAYAESHEKIIPVPILNVTWQTTNDDLLRAHNVHVKYRGGLYITEELNPYVAASRKEHNLRPHDVIVELRCVNPYSPEKKYLEVQTYRSEVFFPSLIKSSFPGGQGKGQSLLLSEGDQCEQVIRSESIPEGTPVWNVENVFPAYKILFQPGDETISIYEKQNASSLWILSPLYEHRKMFFADFLDLLPPGMPLLFILYRNGKKICLEQRFCPTLPQDAGLKLIYPPFQNYKEQYEIVAGMVLMNLFLNHFTVCLPHLVKRLEGKLRFKPAVVVTHLFNLSSVSRMGAIEPLSVLKSIRLFGPTVTKSSDQQAVIRYTELLQYSKLSTVGELRDALNALTDKGISFYQQEIKTNLSFYQSYLHERVLRSEIHSLIKAKNSYQDIDRLLQAKYKQKKTPSESLDIEEEKQLMDKYLPSVRNGKYWPELLTLQFNFEHGNSIHVGFPQIFMEDMRVQKKLQIPLTVFAHLLYEKLQTNLINPFHVHFMDSASKIKHRSRPS